MPGFVVFKRRWSAGSDDLVVPGVFLSVVHFIWIIVVAADVALINYDRSLHSIELLWIYKLVYLGTLCFLLCIEGSICITSLRGSILDTTHRASMQYLIYLKLVTMLLEIAWLIFGIIWLKEYYLSCPTEEAKEIMFALVVCNLLVNAIIVTTVWCAFDAAGRSWVKMKKYQRSMRESESRFNYKRSGSRSRNWRQRKVIRAYEDSWNHRCRLLFCCMNSNERNRNSFTDIARLLSDFFRDLDVVPSDVIAGLVLLRKFQKLERDAIVRQRKNGTFEFLSGAAITESTHFLALHDQHDYEHFQNVIHYMHFAQSAYGWPMFLMTRSRTGICQLCSKLSCCCMPRGWSCCGRTARSGKHAVVINDNCCMCNYGALQKMLPAGDIEVVYVTYHVDVGETPFLVAIDYSKQKVVISIRGTLSMKDILTDLNAEGECLPLDPPREDWLGHKGMVQAAVYIKNKLEEEDLITRTLNHNVERGTDKFGLVLVGHSLGAGTAAILAILLRSKYPSLVCFSFSPPGGLLSMPAVEYSKSFITSVVVGKDVVPRIGLHQMEALRADLINAIKRSVDPKWKTIACSVFCCGCGPEPTSVSEMSSKDANINAYEEQRTTARNKSVHPNDSTIALSLHHPLYPPGRIIHIVRHHPTPNEQILNKHEPVYQAIWAENTDFDEVLISPRMFKDHMPDKVLAALHKVITTCGPKKPQRSSSNANSSITSDMAAEDDIAVLHQLPSPLSSFLVKSQNHKLQLETSFGTTTCTNGTLRHEWDRDSTSSTTLQPVTMTAPTGHNTSISEATTIALDDLNKSNRKNVAFDTKREIITQHTKNRVLSPPPLPMKPKGILLLQQVGTDTAAVDRKRMKKPLSLSFTEVRTTRTISEDSSDGRSRKVDLIHDDWFGLAPLASPESLSEISNISSRAASFGKLSMNASFERVPSFQEETTILGGDCERDDDLLLDNTNEDNMVTPVIMRRAIKIDGELSKCGESWSEVEKYKRHGKIFITPKVDLEANSNTDRDEDSDSSESGRPQLIGSLTFSRPNAQRVNQLILNGGRKPFVEISCSSSSSCASSITGSLRLAPNDDVMLIDLQSKGSDLPIVVSAPDEASTLPGGNTQSRGGQEQAETTIIDNLPENSFLSDTAWNHPSNYFQQEPITSRMASGVIESHFPLIVHTPPGPSPKRTTGKGKSKLISSDNLPTFSQLRQSADSSASNSPARSATPTASTSRPSRIPSVTIQYPQSRASPTHQFNKNRRIYPTTTIGTPTRPKVVSLAADESNV